MFIWLWRYLQARFPLAQFVPLTAALSIGAAALANHGTWRFIVFGGAALMLFFFRLRLFDEIKDAAHDRVHHPERPVAKGEVSLSQIRSLIVPVMTLEAALSWLSGAFFWWLVAVAYSWLLRYEFFIPIRLRSRFLLYTIVHEVLLLPLFAYLFAIHEMIDWRSQTYWQGLVWLGAAMVSLEVGRKIRAPEDEGTGRDTYSANLGTKGAGVLLATCHVVAGWASGALFPSVVPLLWSIAGFGAVVALVYGFRPTRKTTQTAWWATIIVAILIMIVPGLISMFK